MLNCALGSENSNVTLTKVSRNALFKIIWKDACQRQESEILYNESFIVLIIYTWNTFGLK